MKGVPQEDLITDIVSRLKNLHILSREMLTDADLIEALARFRPRSKMFRRVPSDDDVAIYRLLLALRQFRDCLPIEPGDSPFEYRK